MNTTTTDLSQFGARERSILVDLLQAWKKQGLPSDFIDDEVVPTFNTHSGNVFLTNADYQVAMLEGDKLRSFYNCPICGCEGFLEEIAIIKNHSGSDTQECRAWIKDVKANA